MGPISDNQLLIVQANNLIQGYLALRLQGKSFSESEVMCYNRALGFLESVFLVEATNVYSGRSDSWTGCVKCDICGHEFVATVVTGDIEDGIDCLQCDGHQSSYPLDDPEAPMYADE